MELCAKLPHFPWELATLAKFLSMNRTFWLLKPVSFDESKETLRTGTPSRSRHTIFIPMRILFTPSLLSQASYAHSHRLTRRCARPRSGQCRERTRKRQEGSMLRRQMKRWRPILASRDQANNEGSVLSRQAQPRQQRRPARKETRAIPPKGRGRNAGCGPANGRIPPKGNGRSASP